MKKLDIRELPLSTLIITGTLASALSFGYYFALKNPCEIILWLIYIVDFILFFVSAYRVVDSFDLSKTKAIIFTAVTMVGFLAFCEAVVFVCTEGTRVEHTLELFFNVLRISLFLSPSFILLIPVIILIATLMG